MGFKLQYLCAAALFLCLMEAVNIRAQCTLPFFESRNVDLSGSFFSTHSFPDGSIVTFECIIGHKPVNSRASKSVTCEGNQWTSLELTCTKKSCGSLPDFHNGKYEGTGILFGDRMTAVCNTGYMLAGQIKDRWCRDQGWDGRDPVCEVVKCEAPPSIVNGQLDEEPKDNYDYSEVVSYKCNKGLSLIGSSSLHCSEDGTFKPDPPKCLDGCPAPDIENAQRIGGKSPPYKLGNFVDYKCDKGYIMEGDYHIVCSAEGWKPEPPKCIVVKCKTPPTIENGQLDKEPKDQYNLSEVVSYKCIGKFTLTGSPQLHCSEDGTFKPEPPKCLDDNTNQSSNYSKIGLAVGIGILVFAVIIIGVICNKFWMEFWRIISGCCNPCLVCIGSRSKREDSEKMESKNENEALKTLSHMEVTA